jgi:cytosine/uracil/thiamine/allantoin permease
MEVLGEVVAQVLVFSSACLVLAIIGIGVYMRISNRDPFTGKAIPQPRSNLQWLYTLFMSLTFFITAMSQLVRNASNFVRFALLAADILFGVLFILFFIKFLLAWRDEASRSRETEGRSDD